jgi:CBS domain-containing protein
MLVREVMTLNPVTVQPATPVKEALRLLDAHAITAMPVVDRVGAIVGVVSEVDLVRQGLPHDPRAHMIPDLVSSIDPPVCVREVMTRLPVTVSEESDLADAVELMTSTAVKSLPVVDDERRLVGMISRRDVVHRLSRPDEEIEGELDARFRQLGVEWLATVDDGKVAIDGPVGDRARNVAMTTAATVPGVRSVRVAGPPQPGPPARSDR